MPGKWRYLDPGLFDMKRFPPGFHDRKPTGNLSVSWAYFFRRFLPHASGKMASLTRLNSISNQKGVRRSVDSGERSSICGRVRRNRYHHSNRERLAPSIRGRQVPFVGPSWFGYQLAHTPLPIPRHHLLRSYSLWTNCTTKRNGVANAFIYIRSEQACVQPLQN